MIASNNGMESHAALDLSHTRAKDVMRTEVTTLSPEDTIESALATFEDQRIGGAPVTDGNGRLAGVLTFSDVARTEHLSQDRIRTQRGSFDMSEESGAERTDEADPNDVFYVKEDYSPQLLGPELVGDWMTREVISVDPEARLDEVCAAMVNQHIHRVFVTQDRKLLGVISSFDIVRCLAGSVQAQRARN